nr:MAG TPA: Minor capsid protein from bacteriophage [Caudoviricetes sp.]
MAATIIKSLWNYFLACPLTGDRKLNVDYLPESGIEYSIDTTPATDIVKKYTDGSSIRQYLFVFRSVNEYGSDALQNIANSGFYEQFSDWLEQQNLENNYPELPVGKTPIKIEAQSTGYLFTTGPAVGRYQIQCRLLYLQEV